jgi:hypothetical protein
MKPTSLKKFFAAACTLSLLASCGGGGADEAGSPTTFSIIPNSIKVTGPVGFCAAGTVGSVFVYGGAAPYRIDNTVPAYVTIDKGEVAHPGESFSVTFLGGCLDPGNVVVKDRLGKVVTLTLTNEVGKATP